MWVITYKGKPATYKKIFEVEGLPIKLHHLELYQSESYIAFKFKKFAIAKYLFHVGFTWGERARGIEVNKI